MKVTNDPIRINGVRVNEGEGTADLSVAAILDASPNWPSDARVLLGFHAGGDIVSPEQHGFSTTPRKAVDIAQALVESANDVAIAAPHDAAPGAPHRVVDATATVLYLTKDERTILRYVMSTLDPEYGDPLKDTYELGDDEPKDPYATLKSLIEKIVAGAR